MIRYAAGRVVAIVPVLFGVSIVVFLLIRLIPGNPAISILGERATPELVERVRNQLGPRPPRLAPVPALPGQPVARGLRRLVLLQARGHDADARADPHHARPDRLRRPHRARHRGAVRDAGGAPARGARRSRHPAPVHGRHRDPDLLDGHRPVAAAQREVPPASAGRHRRDPAGDPVAIDPAGPDDRPPHVADPRARAAQQPGRGAGLGLRHYRASRWDSGGSPSCSAISCGTA